MSNFCKKGAPFIATGGRWKKSSLSIGFILLDCYSFESIVNLVLLDKYEHLLV